MPCTACPPVEGRYTLVYREGIFGVGCADVAALPNELTIARVGSSVSANYGTAELHGVLHDTYDFTLTGTEQSGAQNEATVQIRARYIDPLRSSDAGATLSGKVTRDYGLADGGHCSVEHRMTGNKQP